jgi:dCTP deaminase
VLSKQAILAAIEQGKINVDPFDVADVQTAHIDLHLIEDLSVAPKAFVISRTIEQITLSDDISGIMEGRAGLAKQGISVEQSSTFVEPGTDNPMTLEIFNASDQTVTLKAGQEIAKLRFFKLIDTL